MLPIPLPECSQSRESQIIYQAHTVRVKFVKILGLKVTLQNATIPAVLYIFGPPDFRPAAQIGSVLPQARGSRPHCMMSPLK